MSSQISGTSFRCPGRVRRSAKIGSAYVSRYRLPNTIRGQSLLSRGTMANACKLASWHYRIRALAMRRIHQSMYMQRNGAKPGPPSFGSPNQNLDKTSENIGNVENCWKTQPAERHDVTALSSKILRRGDAHFPTCFTRRMSGVRVPHRPLLSVWPERLWVSPESVTISCDDCCDDSVLRKVALEWCRPTLKVVRWFVRLPG